MITYRLRRHVQYIPLIALAVGGLAFLPGDENARPSAVAATAEAPALPSYVVRMPDPAKAPVKVASVEPIDVPVQQPAIKAPVSEAMTVAVVDTPAPVEPEPYAPEEEASELAQLAHATTAVNVRAGPSTSTAKLFVLQPGEPVRASATDSGWVEVVTASGESGWVYSRYLEQGGGSLETEPSEIEIAAIERSEPEPEPQGQSARLGGDAALYAAPSRSSERLFVLEAGERVTVAETDGSWARVVLRSGATGWVRMR